MLPHIRRSVINVYVNDLASVIDMEAIHGYWVPIAERYLKSQ